MRFRYPPASELDRRNPKRRVPHACLGSWRGKKNSLNLRAVFFVGWTCSTDTESRWISCRFPAGDRFRTQWRCRSCGSHLFIPADPPPILWWSSRSDKRQRCASSSFRNVLNRGFCGRKPRFPPHLLPAPPDTAFASLSHCTPRRQMTVKSASASLTVLPSEASSPR